MLICISGLCCAQRATEPFHPDAHNVALRCRGEMELARLGEMGELSHAIKYLEACIFSGNRTFMVGALIHPVPKLGFSLSVAVFSSLPKQVVAVASVLASSGCCLPLSLPLCRRLLVAFSSCLQHTGEVVHHRALSFQVTVRYVARRCICRVMAAQILDWIKSFLLSWAYMFTSFFNVHTCSCSPFQLW